MRRKLLVEAIFALTSSVVLVASIHHISAADEASVAEGARIYENYCATCHGEQLKTNSAGLTFDLRRLRSDEYSRFFDSVQNGKNKMPPWKGVLDEVQIEQIWAYVRANISPN